MYNALMPAGRLFLRAGTMLYFMSILRRAAGPENLADAEGGAVSLVLQPASSGGGGWRRRRWLRAAATNWGRAGEQHMVSCLAQYFPGACFQGQHHIRSGMQLGWPATQEPAGGTAHVRPNCLLGRALAGAWCGNGHAGSALSLCIRVCA